MKPTPEFTIRRLKKAVKVMKAVPLQKFNMSQWFAPDYLEKKSKVVVPDNFVYLDCKTVACTWGFMCLDKGFRRMGAGIGEHNTMPYYSDPKFKNGKRYYAEDGGSRLLGITEEEALDLFQPSYYSYMLCTEQGLKERFNLNFNSEIKPRHVIKKLEGLIKEYEAEL